MFDTEPATTGDWAPIREASSTSDTRRTMRPSSIPSSFMLAIFVVCSGACLGLVAQPMAPVHVSQLRIVPPLPFVATKSSRPLFIVLDPRMVVDQRTIPENEVKEIHIYEIQSFVRRDLKRVMESFFSRVEVVDVGTALPEIAHVVAHIRIDSLRTRLNKAVAANDASNISAQLYGEMTWSFAIRLSEAKEYIYSFAGTSVGEYSLTNVLESPTMFASMFEVAIADLLKGYADKNIHAKVLEAERVIEDEQPSG